MRGVTGSGGAVDLTLLPRTAQVSPEGRLRVGGCDLVSLADEYGTPLFVYDEAEIRARCAEYREHFGDGDVAYASKAFLTLAVARLVADEGLLLDVSTGGELHVALAAGFPPERLVFHGNNKSDGELRRALDVGVGRIVVDSFDEIERIDRLGGPDEVAALVRVTPGVEARTHEYVGTGAEDSKFGFSAAAGAAVEACRRVDASPRLHLVGLHAHIGSQIVALEPFAEAAEILARLVTEVEAALGVEIAEVNLGGGLGIRYGAHDRVPAIGEYAATVIGAFDRARAAAGAASRPRLVVEPGRSVVGPAGLTLYRVGTVKQIPGVRTYVAVDGGMSDNPRPATYGARYEAFLPARVEATRPYRVTVAGKHCEQGDILVRDAHLPADVVVGDVLCTPATGAYGYAMASNYNEVPRPAVVFVRGGEARVVVRRETLGDLIRLDQP